MSQAYPPRIPPQTLAYATPGMPRAVPGGLVIGSQVARVLIPKKIDNNYAWYAGAGEVFLQTLPDTL